MIRGVVQNGRFLQEERGWGQGALHKRKGRVTAEQDIISETRRRRDFIMQMAAFSYGDVERAHLTDDLLGLHLKVPDWLIRTLFRGEAETVRSGVKSRFGGVGFYCA